MTTLRIGIVILLAAQPMLLSAIVLWPAFRHPPYIRTAYRARSSPPIESDKAVVQAAWDRKHREDRHFIVVGLSLLAAFAVPLAASIATAGGTLVGWRGWAP